MLEKHHQLHIPYTVFTCAKGICFFTCLFAQLCKNYWADFHKIRWKGGTWAMAQIVRFGNNPDYIMLGRGQDMPHKVLCKGGGLALV